MKNLDTQTDKIELVDYDPQWPLLAKKEIDLIKKSLPKTFILDIQHIGSTAIPGIKAKPVIDLLMRVSSLKQIDAKILKTLRSIGYVFLDDHAGDERFFFAKGLPPFGKKRSHHLHIVENPSIYERHALFPSYLQHHPDEAKNYEVLKMDLAKKHPFDRRAYTQGKCEYFKTLLEKVIAWKNSQE